MGKSIALSEILTDRPIAYHPLLARIGGGVQAGVLLSQLLYWTPRAKSKEGWVWKSQQEWAEETGMTAAEIKRARRDLKKRGLIEEKLAGVPATIHYRASIEHIERLLEEGYEEQKIKRERDEHGRFAPVDHKMVNCPGSPQNGKLDDRKMVNQSTRNRETCLPQDGQLSRDYTETTTEEKEGEALANAQSAGDCLPSQFSLPVKVILRQKHTRTDWRAILEAEQSRAKPRTTLVQGIERKLSINQHPAIIAFRELTGYYPPAGTWRDRVAAAVGHNGGVVRWRETITAWIGSGYNPRNVAGMLECFERGEIPHTGKRAAEDTPPAEPVPTGGFADPNAFFGGTS